MENIFSMSNIPPAAKRLKTNAEDFKVSANECITLHLVDPRRASSFPSPACITSSFRPEFTHQLFGDDEEILGYKGLSINLYFSQTDYQALVAVKFTHKIHGATDILQILQDNFPAGITQDQQHFVSLLSGSTDQQVDSSANNTPDPITHVVLANASEQVKASQQPTTCVPCAYLGAVNMALACRLCMPGCSLYCFSSSMLPVLLTQMIPNGTCSSQLHLKEAKTWYDPPLVLISNTRCVALPPAICLATSSW